jgi:hypothetical protein
MCNLHLISLCFLSGEKCDPDELGRLLQLILGCAINCHHKQGNFFITIIYHTLNIVINPSVWPFKYRSCQSPAVIFFKFLLNTCTKIIYLP